VNDIGEGSTARSTLARFGLGTMAFASPAADPAECLAVVHRAIDAGLTFIDTADVYGQGAVETLLGPAVRARRDEIVLATKCGLPMGERRGLGADRVREATEESLRRLGVERIDLQQLHRPDPATPIEETLGAIGGLVGDGTIGAYGTSCFTAGMLAEVVALGAEGVAPAPLSEQLPLSLLVRSREREVLPACAALGVAAIVWSPLNGGWLTGKYGPDRQVPAGSRGSFAGSFVDPTDAAKAAVVPQLEALAAESGLTLSVMALAWAAAQPGVSTVLIGARTVEQLDALLPAAAVTLGADLQAAIDAVVAPGTTVDPRNDAWPDPPRLNRAG
jgi:aryl-alcohol dehydrogenase-like predicted oxidoreductase